MYGKYDSVDAVSKVQMEGGDSLCDSHMTSKFDTGNGYMKWNGLSGLLVNLHVLVAGIGVWRRLRGGVRDSWSCALTGRAAGLRRSVDVHGVAACCERGCRAVVGRRRVGRCSGVRDGEASILKRQSEIPGEGKP